MKTLAVMIVLIASTSLLLTNPAAAVSNNQGMSGRYACECMSGDYGVAGTCSVKANSHGRMVCGKHEGDTCTATCTMMTFTHGATGGSIAISPGASQKSGPTLQKAP